MQHRFIISAERKRFLKNANFLLQKKAPAEFEFNKALFTNTFSNFESFITTSILFFLKENTYSNKPEFAAFKITEQKNIVKFLKPEKVLTPFYRCYYFCFFYTLQCIINDQLFYFGGPEKGRWV